MLFVLLILILIYLIIGFLGSFFVTRLTAPDEMTAFLRAIWSAPIWPYYVWKFLK